MKTLKSIKGRVWAWMNGPQANQNEISFFDVKELYDAAFAEKAKAEACMKTYESLMARAEALDIAYRAQLAAARPAAYGRKAA